MRDIDTPLWSYSLGNYVHQLVISDNGKYIAEGESNGRARLFDSTGVNIWTYSVPYGGIVGADISLQGGSVVIGSDDPSDSRGCIIAFFSSLTNGEPGWQNTDGTPLWSFHPPQGHDDFYDVAISGDGKYVSGGGSSIPNYLFDYSGNLVHDYDPGSCRSTDISISGRHVVYGRSAVFYAPTYSDTFTQELSTDGSRVLSIAVTARYDTVYIAAGCENNTVYFFQAGTINAIDPSPVPLEFDLSDNHPNPFNAATRIEYTLPVHSNVRLDIFNIMGQRVENLVNCKQQPGEYSVLWNAADYPSGIYFYRFSVENNTTSKKMILLK